MRVPVSIAQNIVDRMKEVINKEITFKNTEGYIIASTDENRIGNFHERILEAIQNKETLIISKEEEDLEKDEREGISIPIFLEDEIVGVVGITGVVEEVKHYGEIIKSMTEILIREAFIYQQKYLEKQNYNYLIEDIIFNISDKDFESIKDQAKFMGIDYSLTRTIIQLEAQTSNITLSGTIMNDSRNSIESILGNNSDHIIVQNGMSFIILYNGYYDDVLHNSLEKISNYFIHNIGAICNIGVGLTVSNLADIRKSYQTSSNALKISKNNNDGDYLVYFGDLDTELLISDISSGIKDIYIKKVFSNIKKNELADWVIFLDKYVSHNGSIQKVAEDLFLHKNTIQYRLDKIKKLTGYNPREQKDLIKLALAIYIYKYKENQ
jgi:carbohydrate diacid regulator